ncbi:tyrosine 3-monooxygenase [Lutzomyia longipalpis]|uniref:Putative aromatic amino acid hydroxylase n=1 Tax=Lutzomyia longipalpis TaxID=7200 RepID=A0A7G3A890_LUTLO|nr:tyrosine 3-monooxygenase [Lutzomyia longipalpis]
MAVAAAQKNREMFAIKKSYSIENGYPSRRRSLVDDARFETLVVKQTKQSVLEEARQRANDTLDDCHLPNEVHELQNVSQDDKVQIHISTADDQLNGESIMVEDVFDKSDDDEISLEKNETPYENDCGLTEDEVLLANAASESPEAEKKIQRAALVVRLREGMGSLGRILKAIETFHGAVIHLESRPSRAEGVQFDVLAKVDMSRANLLQLIRALRQTNSFGSVNILTDDSTAVKTPWFPKHASELDNCNHLMTKYEPDLDMNHPGFADKTYRARRKEIAEIAFAYKYGDPIPHIEYTEDENKTWRAVFNTVKDLIPKHACIEYRRVFEKLIDEGIFREDGLPQLEEMSSFLRRNTGFTLRPAAGLLTARDFLASLAFRIFQSTQYVRHVNTPYHTPEPDAIHEIIGHQPLLGDPSFAQFSQEIGLASLGASDEEIEKLATVYWFTVEFGLCKEQGQVKAYGAGLLSAYGELLHALSDKPEHRPFEPATTAVQKYQDQDYQPIYYVAESFEDAKDKFRRWVSAMSRPFEVRFNPHTERVEVLDSVDKLQTLVAQMKTEILHLTNAIDKLGKPFC